ncbi:Uncharacterised protein [Mycobacteroides abscessus subsp. massiliense]|nr:Uncharacterised protein [Mycobacteroides abscessus subsp. massiliense]
MRTYRLVKRTEEPSRMNRDTMPSASNMVRSTVVPTSNLPGPMRNSVPVSAGGKAPSISVTW